MHDRLDDVGSRCGLLLALLRYSLSTPVSYATLQLGQTWIVDFPCSTRTDSPVIVDSGLAGHIGVLQLQRRHNRPSVAADA